MTRARAASTYRTRSRARGRVAVVQTLRLADGRALSVRRWPGAGEETLVLLHGLLDSAQGWSRLAGRLPGERIAFDLPGFGCSDPPSRGSIDGYARDIAEGLEILGVRRLAVVGHSLGGAVAAALAERLSDRVTALVLLAPAGFGRIPLAEIVSIPGVRTLVELVLPLVLSSRLAVTAGYLTMVSHNKLPEPQLVDRVTSRGRFLLDGVREGTRSLTEAGRSPHGFHHRRVRYDGPVHAVWGDRDRLVPVSHQRGVLAAFPQAHIHVWKGMGHDPIHERTDQLIGVVREAIAQRRLRRNRTAPPLSEAA
jgi:pimeloyl-ACP methyl ester carboxylesterase